MLTPLLGTSGYQTYERIKLGCVTSFRVWNFVVTAQGNEYLYLEEKIRSTIKDKKRSQRGRDAI